GALSKCAASAGHTHASRLRESGLRAPSRRRLGAADRSSLWRGRVAATYIRRVRSCAPRALRSLPISESTSLASSSARLGAGDLSRSVVLSARGREVQQE